ncbi:MAG: hypothetical protein EOP60_05525 [Sphingomonadales bacterium]|nr:MAG: hypothetical protein EOP60_05525 [Sphingomonadales bacterium]
MHRQYWIASTACMALALPASAQESDLGWLVGKWCTEKSEAARTTTCETWTPIGNGVMRGLGKTLHERYITIDEQMEIRRDGEGFVLHSEPIRQKPTNFFARGVQPAMAVRFENRAHDYPQVVRYWREGDMLMAEISLADGSKPRRWTYRREPVPE